MTKKLNRKGYKSLASMAIAIVLLGNVFFAAAATTFPVTSKSKMDSIIAGAELNERIAQEGMVLIKNVDNALPLKTDAAEKITLLGYASVVPNGGGRLGDTGENSAGVAKLTSDIYSSLKDAGYSLNPTVEGNYRKWIEAGKNNDYALASDFNAAKDSMKSSLAEYGDAAVVVLSSTSAYNSISLFGGLLNLKLDDGKVIKADAVPEGDTVDRAHTLMIDKAQHDLLKYANDNFSKVIVVINTSIPIELGFINDAKYPNIKAAIVAGEPGASGFNALGDILNGTVSPSGRLPDLYAKDLTTNPTWVNFGSNGTAGTFPEGMTSFMMPPLTPEGNSFTDENGNTRPGWFTDYEEGIYIGYRYYETRGFTEKEKNASSTWYEDNVLYPFGYGLSYTTFSQEIVSSTPAAKAALAKDTTITVDVKVTNTGNVAGKEVVQLYYTAPYTAGGTEKSHVVLGDYAKTKLLAPGESETVKVELKASDMASYDWQNDKTYVLDAGSYSVKVMNNSHDVIGAVDYTVDAKILCDTAASGTKIENQFEDVNQVILNNKDKTVLSRSDWEGTWPTVPAINAASPKDDGRYISAEDFAKLNLNTTVTAEVDAVSPWKATTAPTVADPTTRPEKASVLLRDLTGKTFEDPQWETLLDQLSVEEMMNIVNNGGFKSIEIPYVGKPLAFDTDGPMGWSGNGVGGETLTRFVSAPFLASTWSKELAHEMGTMIGEQALWGNTDTETDIKIYSGWYAPAMNTHRTPLDTRYNEYYSEDGVLAGKTAANVIQGAMTKGVYTTVKHFAVHEDGGLTYRGLMGGDTAATSGLSVWVNEQALRELYLRPFQIAVEQGGARAAMSSFSRIGYTWAGANHSLLTKVLRNEWGFRGFVVSDIEIYDFMNANAMIRAGGDMILNSSNGPIRQVTAEAGDQATHLTALRNVAHNVLYVVANSNAMQAPANTKMTYAPEAAMSNGMAGAAYSTYVSGVTFENTVSKTFPVAYTVSAGQLPEGLTLNASTGEIAGTPMATGEFKFTVSAAVDGIEAPATHEFTMTVDRDPNKVSVTFNTNEGSANPNTILVTIGEKIVAPADPTKEGFVFAGWYDNAELTGNAVDFATYTASTDIILNAKWTEATNTTLIIILVILGVLVVACVIFVVTRGKKKK